MDDGCVRLGQLVDVSSCSNKRRGLVLLKKISIYFGMRKSVNMTVSPVGLTGTYSARDMSREPVPEERTTHATRFSWLMLINCQQRGCCHHLMQPVNLDADRLKLMAAHS